MAAAATTSQDKILEEFRSVVGLADETSTKYMRIRQLGNGSFGQAWLLKRRSDGMKFVGKTMDVTRMSLKDSKYVEAEVQCMAECVHFAVVRYEEDFTSEKGILIVMEYADAGDMNMQIKSRAQEGFRYFEEHEIGYTFVQILMALDYIHRNRMLHRDIKGANILLQSSGLVKLGDFGFSHKYDETVSESVAKTFCGTPYYLAPEMWRRERYSKKADIWSLGVLTYEMMALTRPFTGATMKELMQKIFKANYDPLPTRYSPELRAVVESILVDDPNKRPSTAELFAMPKVAKLLSDFEKSVSISPNISAETKKLIQENIDEIKSTTLGDMASGTNMGPGAGNTRTAIAHEGPIKKESNGVWKDRYLTLAGGELIISVRKGEGLGKPLPVKDISTVVPIPFATAKLPGVFALNTTDKKVVWLQGQNKTDAYTWIHRIQQAMGVG